jgi:hypothetical protein
MTRKSAEELARLGIAVPPVQVVESQDIEAVVGNTDLAELARSEAFMNERLMIRLATTTDPNAPPFATVCVNDVNNRVVIPRGNAVPVKRMHVEVLARMRETRFTQPARNPMDPESGNGLIPHHAQVYPFEVLRDDNPMGRPWLDAILSEPAY